jgi:PadR family transcriptional regulator PadR
MTVEKSLINGSTSVLLLKLLEEKDMYGYQMIEELGKRSKNVFELKAGTLYPILHALEQKGYVVSYNDGADGGRVRKYYSITREGRRFLRKKREEWDAYSTAVSSVLGGADVAKA